MPEGVRMWAEIAFKILYLICVWGLVAAMWQRRALVAPADRRVATRVLSAFTMIIISYACYTPVILFVQQEPLLGMLMIPKTVAYLGVAIIAFRALYLPKARSVAVVGG